ELDRPHAAFGEHRTEEAALAERAVQQRSTPECAIAECRTDVLGLGHVDAAEVALGEHDTLGAQSAQVVVAEVVAVEFPLGPDRFVVTHAVSRAAARDCSARTR